MAAFRWLWKTMKRRDQVLFCIAMVSSVVSTLMLLINPILSARLVDEVLIPRNTEPLNELLAWIFIVQLLRLSIRYGMVMCFESSTQAMLVRLQANLFAVVQHQEASFFHKYRTGDLITRLSGDAEYCRSFMSWPFYFAFENIIQFISALIIFWFVEWRMALALLLITPLLFFITKLYRERVAPLFDTLREHTSNMNTITQENISGIRVVKAFAQEEAEKTQFEQINRLYMQTNLVINKTWLTFFPMLNMLANSMTLISLFLGAYFVIQGDMTPGALSIFTSLSWMLSSPVNNLGPLLNDFQRFATSASKIQEIFYSKPTIVDHPDAVAHDKMDGNIVFDNVSLKLGNNQVLENISFSIKAGQTLAIMGSTGSGKSSIVNLLGRFYDPSEGVVLVDGCPAHMWKLNELRQNIAVATQEVFLFSDTIANNIAFCDENMPIERIVEFAQRAGASEFIDKLPDGYDTIIGERGVGLSGGQRQRLALARAMASQASVLVLDDTTSALDNETEQYIQQQLKQLPYPCTKIIIAQRVSSVYDADHIVVLDHGKILEEGTHEALLAKHGYYYETYCLQNDIVSEGGEY